MPDNKPTSIRDLKGRFLVGNPGGPGYAHVGQVERVRSALLQAITPEQHKALAKKLLSLAMGGDIQAARLLWLYTIGPPEVSVALRTPDDPARVSFRALVEESFARSANGHGAAVIEVEGEGVDQGSEVLALPVGTGAPAREAGTEPPQDVGRQGPRSGNGRTPSED